MNEGAPCLCHIAMTCDCSQDPRPYPAPPPDPSPVRPEPEPEAADVADNPRGFWGEIEVAVRRLHHDRQWAWAPPHNNSVLKNGGAPARLW